MQFHAKYPLFDSQSERDFTFLAMRFHAKYPLFDSQSDREFTFSYAILTERSTYLAITPSTVNHATNQMKSIVNKRIKC